MFWCAIAHVQYTYVCISFELPVIHDIWVLIKVPASTRVTHYSVGTSPIIVADNASKRFSPACAYLTRWEWYKPSATCASDAIALKSFISRNILKVVNSDWATTTQCTTYNSKYKSFAKGKSSGWSEGQEGLRPLLRFELSAVAWAPDVNENMVLSMLKSVILCSKCVKFPIHPLDAFVCRASLLDLATLTTVLW